MIRNVLLIAASGLAAAILLIAVGLRVQPRSFAAYPATTPTVETVPVPPGLPAPVERFYRAAYGERVPVIHSAVYTSRGTVRFMGLTFPARARFSHIAGQHYRHYMEATVWGLPLIRVNEWFLDGHSRLELPVGVVENEWQVDAAANLGLWAETLAMPSVYVTDSRLRWEAIDDNSARLIVPSPEGEDTLTFHFDPQTGLITTISALRWQNPGDTEKVAWGGETLGWRNVDGMLLPTGFAVTWQHEGSPWLVLNLEEVIFNVDLSEYIHARGL